MAEKKLVTISLLCCGRPDTTERCLKSVMPIRQAVDSELIVIDTGCDKETRAVIEKYADEVIDFKWVNDFAKARNFQLETAHGKWLLYLDDDEFFIKTESLINFFNSGEYKKFNLGGYTQRNFLDYENKEWEDCRVVRMTTIKPETKFIGKVHEYIVPYEGPTMLLNDYVGHYGYIFETEEKNIEHSNRNIPLLKEMMEEDPTEARWPYQLGQELKATHKNEELLELANDCIKRFKNDDAIGMLYRDNFLCAKAVALEQLNKSEELLALFEEVKNDKLVADIPKAKISCYCIRQNYMLGRFHEAIEVGEYYLRAYEKYGNDERAIFNQGGIFVDDTFNVTHLNHAYAFMIAAGLRLEDLSVLTHYYKKIAWESPVLRISKGFLSDLVTTAAVRGYEKSVSGALNKFFIRHGLKLVLINEIRTMHDEYLNATYIKNLRANVKGTKNQAEMDPFFDAKLEEIEFLQTESYASIDEMENKLREYIKNCLTWWELFIKDCDEELTESDKPREIIFAEEMTKFFDTEASDYKKSLKHLKRAAGLNPPLSRTINEFSKKYGDLIRINMIAETDPKKFEEMYNLELAVRKQISDLETSGHGADASTTRGQLEAIIEQTYGVKSLLI